MTMSAPQRKRTPKVRVAYCLRHECWSGPEEIGSVCGISYCNRTLVKRVGYLCAERGLHRLQREAKACEGGHY